jgi:hypothetical protein
MPPGWLNRARAQYNDSEMSGDLPDFSQFPKVIPASAGSTQKYHLVASHFAVHGRQSQAETGSVLEFLSEQIAVYPVGRFPQFARTALETSPVYSLQPGGSLAVPTGRVFVRLRPDSRFADHERDFRNAGYEIDQTISHAPHAGWVRPSSFSIASSLTGLDKLAAIGGVEGVEPQMLQKAVRKV